MKNALSHDGRSPLLRYVYIGALSLLPSCGAPFPSTRGCPSPRWIGTFSLARVSSGRGWIDLLLRAWTSTDFLTILCIWFVLSLSKGVQPVRTLPHGSSSTGCKGRLS